MNGLMTDDAHAKLEAKRDQTREAMCKLAKSQSCDASQFIMGREKGCESERPDCEPNISELKRGGIADIRKSVKEPPNSVLRNIGPSLIASRTSEGRFHTLRHCLVSLLPR